MAFSRSINISSIVLVIFTTFFLLLATKANSQKKVSFNFSKFSYSQSDLIFQGSTYIYGGGGGSFLNGALALPGPIGPTVGRVLYSKQVPIWDSTTGNVANFETSFTFEVLKDTFSPPGDGVVFFLTDPTSAKNIPDNSGQGLLGVANAKDAFNRFVGVEFDTYSNPWDPNYAHVGINLNSLYSAKVMKWRWVYGTVTYVKVKIIYDSPSSTLTVVVTDEDGQVSTLSQMLDLKWLLPEMAMVGISGAAGISQMNDIFSWSFSSVLNTTTRSSSSNNINNITASY